MQTISAADLKPLLTAGPEIAFIDVREHGQYGEGHPFFVVSIPYSVLETRIGAMVPRRSIDLVLLDDDDGVAERAADRLTAMGYTCVRKMAGGAAAWAAAGFTLYKGVNLPSKTMGELVEHAAHTPRLTAPELMAMKEAGKPFILLDGRTPAEFHAMNIDGALSCPNAELGHRLGQFVPDETTPVVINCAGRTRSIIGAQGLINQGIANPIYALENGTAGWQLAGYTLNWGKGGTELAPLDEAGQALSRTKAEALRSEFGVPQVDLATMRGWMAQTERTTYLLDVRTAEEFAAGHLPGSRHAPGGQLAQATDLVIGARGARIVLIDDTGLRAVNTAIWLMQMAHEVHVLGVDVTGLSDQETGAHRVPEPGMAICTATDAARMVADGAILLDLNGSMTYRKGHIRGAQWAIRPRLDGGARGAALILTAADPQVAALAAVDLREQGHTDLRYLPDDRDGWLAAGFEIEASPDTPPDADCIDYLFFVHDRHHGNLVAAQGYLDWETGLLDQLDAQEAASFPLHWR